MSAKKRQLHIFGNHRAHCPLVLKVSCDENLQRVQLYKFRCALALSVGKFQSCAEMLSLNSYVPCMKLSPQRHKWRLSIWTVVHDSA